MDTRTDDRMVPAAEPVIRVARLIRAPRERVWAAWTDPGRVSHWWGPDGFSTTTHAHDLRPGGTWRFTMHGPDGTDYGNRVVFERVEAPALLAYDHFAEGDADDAPHFKARVDFAEAGAATRVTLTMNCPTFEKRAAMLEFGAVAGAEQTLARFAAMVE